MKIERICVVWAVACLLGLLGPGAGAQAPDAAKPVMTLDREHSVLAGYPGDELRISVTVPAALRNAPGKLKASIADSDGRWLQTLELAVDADASQPQSLAFLPKQSAIGYYDVALTLWQGESKVQDLYTSFSVLTAVPTISDDSRFGVYTVSDLGIVDPWLPKGYVDVLNKSGARWGTFTSYWFLVQPKPDVWDWSSLDHRFEFLKQAHIQPIPTIFGIPEWASSYKDGMPIGGDGLSFHVYPPKDMDAWGRYVYAFVERYRDQLRYLRIWNEFDNDYFMGTAHDFADMLKVAYREAHRAKPDIQIIIDTSFAKTYYYEMLWREGAADSFDVIAIHNYHQLDKVLPPEQTMFRQEYEAISAWRDRRIPGRPIIDDEFGIFAERSWMSPSWLGQGSVAHANQMVRAHLLGFASGVQRMVWFPVAAYNVVSKDKTYTESAGLLHTDLSPQPAYSAYQTMSTLLQNAAFVKELAMPSPSQHACVFRAEGSVITAVWNTTDVPEWASFLVSGDHVDRVAMLGARDTLPVEDGFFSVPLMRSPQYIVSGQELQIEERRVRFASYGLKLEVGGAAGDLERPVLVEAASHSSRANIVFADIAGGNAAGGFPMQLSPLNGQKASSTGKLAVPSATSSGRFPTAVSAKENDGDKACFPISVEVKTQDKPLWRAATAQTPARYIHPLPAPRQVESIMLTLPEESASCYRVEVAPDANAPDEQWRTVRPVAVGHGAERISVGGPAIAAIRVTFEQLLASADLEDPKQFQPIPQDPKNTPDDFIKAGGWCTGRQEMVTRVPEAHTGGNGIKIDAPKRSDGWTTCDQYFRVKENTYYSFSAYAKVPDDADHNGSPGLAAVNGDNGQLFLCSPLTHADGQWHRYFFTALTEPGQTRMRVSCLVAGRGKAFFDDIMAVEGTLAPDIPMIVALDVKDAR